MHTHSIKTKHYEQECKHGQLTVSAKPMQVGRKLMRARWPCHKYMGTDLVMHHCCKVTAGMREFIAAEEEQFKKA